MDGLVSVVVVNWSSADQLSSCIPAILCQTYPHIELLVIDNASIDSSVQLLESVFPSVRLVKNPVNVGYAPAHNQGIRLTQGEYYMALNPDVTMAPTFVEHMVKAFDTGVGEGQRVGSVTGKLLAQCSEPGATDGATASLKLDSGGLFLNRLRLPFDRGQGEIDRGQYDRLEWVFGACGAAPLYRRTFLQDIAVSGEVFDESYFAYFEDVDIAMRAAMRGWRCLYTPFAVAYHGRRRSDSLRGPRPGPDFVRVHAVKNRYATMIKSEPLAGLLRDAPLLLAYELARLGYAALFAPRSALLLIRAMVQSIAELPRTLSKRRMIRARRTTPDAAMRSWIVSSRTRHYLDEWSVASRQATPVG